MNRYKIPVSVLVVIHTRDLDVLLLERADRPAFWQSVTGSQHDEGEMLRDTAIRETKEETGLDAADHVLIDWRKQNEFEIFPIWRRRYAPGITRNTEHVFGLTLPRQTPITIAPREHYNMRGCPGRRRPKKCFRGAIVKPFFCCRNLPAGRMNRRNKEQAR